MKKLTIGFIILIIIAVSLGGYLCLNHTEPAEKRTLFAFDTIINLTVSGKDSTVALDECEKEIYRLEKIFNAHSTSSELSRLNREGALYPVEVSEELYGVIERSIGYSEDTLGAFDITTKPLSDLWDVKSEKKTLPHEDDVRRALEKVSYKNIVLYPQMKIGFSSEDTLLDLGGVAKGYAADRLKEIIDKSAVDWALIDLGGNIYCVGDREFSIGIQHPKKERGEYYDVISVKDASVVTSGGYERGFEKDGRFYHHIISPYDGYPADSGVISVTVVGESGEMCDAYSTGVYVYGRKLAEDICSVNEDVFFVIMDREGNIQRVD